MTKKPVLDYTPAETELRPVAGKVNGPKKWTFSFQYWQEVKFFGFSGTESKWFVSMLTKLHLLSQEPIENFVCDVKKQSDWRYHRINWNQTNIPIRPSDLKWLPAHYKDNQKEYPFVQFQVSQTLGRVVGFWNEANIFEVVLLDPLHNMQPTEATGYRVDPNDPLRCEYTLLVSNIDAVIEECCHGANCECIEKIKNIKTYRDTLLAHNIVMLKIKDDDMADYCELKQSGTAKSVHDVFREGLDAKRRQFCEATPSEEDKSLTV